MSTPRFEVVDRIFVITCGAACPSFACEDEFNAKIAMHSLNELLDRAEAAEAVEVELHQALNTALDRAKAAEAREAGLRKVANEAKAFIESPAARPLGAIPAEADDLIDALLAAGLEVRA